MSEKSIEMMKKLIEEKNKKNIKQGSGLRAEKSIGGSQKAFRNKKSGGVFD